MIRLHLFAGLAIRGDEGLTGLQRKPLRSPNSSSFTQSKVPLMIVREPSWVSGVIAPVAMLST